MRRFAKGAPAAPRSWKKALRWAFSIFMFSGGLVYLPSAAGILLFAAAVFSLPIRSMDKLFEERLHLTGKARAVVMLGLFLVSLQIAPNLDTQSTAGSAPKRTAVVQTVKNSAASAKKTAVSGGKAAGKKAASSAKSSAVSAKASAAKSPAVSVKASAAKSSAVSVKASAAKSASGSQKAAVKSVAAAGGKAAPSAAQTANVSSGKTAAGSAGAGKSASTEAKTPAKTVAAAPAAIAQTVYITPTGKHYHLNPHCGNGVYSPVSLEKAKSMGLTPCKKCAGG